MHARTSGHCRERRVGEKGGGGERSTFLKRTDVRRGVCSVSPNVPSHSYNFARWDMITVSKFSSGSARNKGVPGVRPGRNNCVRTCFDVRGTLLVAGLVTVCCQYRGLVRRLAAYSLLFSCWASRRLQQGAWRKMVSPISLGWDGIQLQMSLLQLH